MNAQLAIAPSLGNEREFDIRSVIGLLRRQLRLILVTLVLGLVVASAALFVLKPVYTALTLIMVDPSRKDLLDPEAQLSGSGSDSARVDSEVELIKAEPTLVSAIEALNLLEDPEFGVALGIRDRILSFFHLAQPSLPTGDAALKQVVRKLSDALTVQRRGLTYLIAIQAHADKPQTAARIANAVAEAYIRDQLASKVETTLASRNIIQGRITEASAAVARSEEAFDTFIAENLETIASQTGRSDLLELRSQLREASSRRTEAARLSELVTRDLAAADWQGIADSLSSQTLAALENNRSALEAMLTSSEAGSPQAADLKAQLAELEAQLRTTATAEVSTLQKSVADAQTETTNLRNQLRDGVLQADLPGDVLTSLYALQQNADNARSQYQTLLARANTLDAQAALQVADSRIVAEALPPDAPSFPNPRLILSLAALASLALGIGLAFLVENVVGGFTSEGQVESVLRVRVASVVPRQKGAGTAGAIAQGIVDAPLSTYAEALRRTRLGVDQAARRTRATEGERSGGIVVMVASAEPGEGKTTLALSLARAYALGGLSTLLIDCDLRKPSVHRQLGVELAPTLAEYLAADNPPKFDALTVGDSATNARVILGSRRTAGATDGLVSGGAFSRLISEARKAFDVVVLDSPPIGPVVDGVYLAPLADTIIFVVQFAATSQWDARSAVKALSDAKRPASEIVAVLNQQPMSKSSYRSRYAGYYTEA